MFQEPCHPFGIFLLITFVLQSFHPFGIVDILEFIGSPASSH
jgi:hypothetical protein